MVKKSREVSYVIGVVDRPLNRLVFVHLQARVEEVCIIILPSLRLFVSYNLPDIQTHESAFRYIMNCFDTPSLALTIKYLNHKLTSSLTNSVLALSKITLAKFATLEYLSAAIFKINRINVHHLRCGA